MKIAIASLARDNITYKGHSLNQVNRFFDQILSQSIRRYADIEVFIEEGDSVDNTYEELIKWRERLSNLHILKYDTNTTQKIASRESQPRYKHLSHIGDVLLDYIIGQGNYNYLMWQELDLIIKDDQLIEKLLEGFGQEKIGVVSPMVKCDGGGLTGKHYDTLCFRTPEGTRWSQTYNPPAILGKYIEMGSIGSCCLVDYEVIERGRRFNSGCFMNFSKEVRDLGYNIVVRRDTTMFHPTNRCVDSRWI